MRAQRRAGMGAVVLAVIALAASTTPGIANWWIAGPLYGLAAILGAWWFTDQYRFRGQPGFVSRVVDVRENERFPGLNLAAIELITPGFREMEKRPTVEVEREGVSIALLPFEPLWERDALTPNLERYVYRVLLPNPVKDGDYLVRWQELHGLGTRLLARPQRFTVYGGRVMLPLTFRFGQSLGRLGKGFRGQGAGGVDR